MDRYTFQEHLNAAVTKLSRNLQDVNYSVGFSATLDADIKTLDQAVSILRKRFEDSKTDPSRMVDYSKNAVFEQTDFELISWEELWTILKSRVLHEEHEKIAEKDRAYYIRLLNTVREIVESYISKEAKVYSNKGVPIFGYDIMWNIEIFVFDSARGMLTILGGASD